MTSQFAPPADPSSGITWQHFNGTLMVLDVKAVETGIKTQYGETDAVRVDVHPLDGPEAGTTIPDTLVFPKVLVSQLRQQVGRQVLGRLGQGQGKPGQSPPWILEAAEPADTQLAERWATARMQAPAGQQQPAQQGADVPF